MGLFDLFRRSSPPAQPAPAAGYGFERDPERMFDPERADRLAELLAIPRERRDPAWMRAFWDSAWTAALVVPEPPVALGPDRFPYARLQLPGAASAHGSNSLMNIAASLVDQGAGAALFAAPSDDMAAAEYVIPMGVLDSILRYDNPEGEPAELDEIQGGLLPAPGASILKAGEQVMMATPSPAYLPPSSARAMHRHLLEEWGLADPRVALLVAGSMRPTRSLVISQTRADWLGRGATEAQISGWMERLLWFLPPSRSLMLLPDDWSDADMTPLSRLF